MLVIRKEQLDAFAKEKEKKFEREAFQYIKTTYPDKCKSLTDDQIKESILTAKQKSENYSLFTTETVMLYIDLMYLLGFDFDTDKNYPWVQEILLDDELRGRTRMLYLKSKANNLE